LPVFIHLKELYISWHSKFYKFPKTSKFSIGTKIDSLFVYSIEQVSLANITYNIEKLGHIKIALSSIDTLKVFLQIAWELGLVETKHYSELSEKIDVVGKMLGGWYGQTLKQNSPAKAREK